MRLEKRVDGWWITNTGDIDYGPYSSRADAHESRANLHVGGYEYD